MDGSTRQLIPGTLFVPWNEHLDTRVHNTRDFSPLGRARKLIHELERANPHDCGEEREFDAGFKGLLTKMAVHCATAVEPWMKLRNFSRSDSVRYVGSGAA